MPIFSEKPSSLKLLPSTEWMEKKEGSELSIMCTTENMKYYSKNFSWVKENSVLPNTYDVVRHSTFVRLDFKMLKVEDSGRYTCNITDDESIQGKSFQLFVFGK